MILDIPIKGENIQLRTATPDDAQFILDLRLNPKLNQYIGKTNSSLKKQEEWIANKQKARNDYHMIIESPDNKKFGTIAIYDILPDCSQGEWGRWIIQPKSPFYVPFESAILMYHFALSELELKIIYNGVQNKNTKSINFHKTFGGDITSSDEKETWFEFRLSHLEKVLNKYQQFHHLVIR